MKIKDLPNLSVDSKVLQDLDVDHVQLIVDNEFQRRFPVMSESKKYEDRAIDVLIENKLSFHNNFNLTWEMIKRFISIKCPYCGNQMEYSSGGANSDSSNSSFVCKSCGAKAGLNLAHDSGLYFNPPK